jgi:hypothetical protein
MDFRNITVKNLYLSFKKVGSGDRVNLSCLGKERCITPSITWDTLLKGSGGIPRK